jgi:hypothetical protein
MSEHHSLIRITETGDSITDDRTCEETNEIDPVIPREVWRSIVWDFFVRMAESYPENYNLVAIRQADPEMFDKISEQSRVLESLGDLRRSVIESTFRRLHGVLTQAYWHRQGFRADEMFLDEDGDVVAVMLTERLFGSEKLDFWCLAGAWVTADDSFSSPDGSPVYQAEELEKLSAMDDEIISEDRRVQK